MLAGGSFTARMVFGERARARVPKREDQTKLEGSLTAGDDRTPLQREMARRLEERRERKVSVDGGASSTGGMIEKYDSIASEAKSLTPVADEQGSMVPVLAGRKNLTAELKGGLQAVEGATGEGHLSPEVLRKSEEWIFSDEQPSIAHAGLLGAQPPVLSQNDLMSDDREKVLQEQVLVLDKSYPPATSGQSGILKQDRERHAERVLRRTKRHSTSPSRQPTGSQQEQGLEEITEEVPRRTRRHSTSPVRRKDARRKQSPDWSRFHAAYHLVRASDEMLESAREARRQREQTATQAHVVSIPEAHEDPDPHAHSDADGDVGAC